MSTELFTELLGLGPAVDLQRCSSSEGSQREASSLATAFTDVRTSNGTLNKGLGAYYTDLAVARFLLRWAVVAGHETVLDPGFGGGVFLIAAAERIRELGGDPRRQVYGIEINPAAYQAFVSRGPAGLPAERLLPANFFEVRPENLSLFDAVVGNPPFIRYQRFSGRARQVALDRAREAGVPLSGLASSWAPFLVHAARFVKAGGRLGMVAPAELAHASYARPVLEYLRRSFRTIRILTFSRKLFPRLSEDTLLVLAAGRGAPFESLSLVDLPDVAALDRYPEPDTQLPSGIAVSADGVDRDRGRLLHYLLPEATRDLYRELRSSAQVAVLRDLAEVGIGYVTGDNDFFHLNRATVEAYGLPVVVLRPAARSGSDLAGLRFTRDDWEALHRSGHANFLLYLRHGQRLPDSVQAYLEQGVRKGVPQRYKCRVRQPWYCVPQVYRADGFLTYMSGYEPKLAANEADAVAANTLHVIRLLPMAPVGIDGLAALWQTSLSALSCELEGHSLGGGMLKLEPREAQRVAIALPEVAPGDLRELGDELDRLLRSGKTEAARQRADAVILQQGLGLPRRDIVRLHEGWLALRERRLKR